MIKDEISIFSGNASKKLTQAICKELDLPVGDVNEDGDVDEDQDEGAPAAARRSPHRAAAGLVGVENREVVVACLCRRSRLHLEQR